MDQVKKKRQIEKIVGKIQYDRLMDKIIENLKKQHDHNLKMLNIVNHRTNEFTDFLNIICDPNNKSPEMDRIAKEVERGRQSVERYHACILIIERALSLLSSGRTEFTPDEQKELIAAFGTLSIDVHNMI